MCEATGWRMIRLVWADLYQPHRDRGADPADAARRRLSRPACPTARLRAESDSCPWRDTPLERSRQ